MRLTAECVRRLIKMSEWAVLLTTENSGLEYYGMEHKGISLHLEVFLLNDDRSVVATKIEKKRATDILIRYTLYVVGTEQIMNALEDTTLEFQKVYKSS